MTIPIDLAARRRKLRPDSLAQDATAPCDSESLDESGLVQVSREQERAKLSQWEDLVTTLLTSLEQHQFPTQAYRGVLADEQPLIDEYYTLIPESSNPYSPQASESRAVLTHAQHATCAQTVTNLKELAERLAAVVRLVLQIKQTQLSMNTLRSLAPRQFTASNLYGTGEGLQPVVDCAADPQGNIARAERLLGQAHAATVDERFGDAEALIQQAVLVPGLLRIIAQAEACGAIVEKEPVAS